MILVTGDIHSTDLDRFKDESFIGRYTLSKSDYVIICGDFGCIWKHGVFGNKRALDRISKLPFTTLFVDGNHENFDVLNAYPEVEWMGGKVHRIRDDIIHLMRGEVYELENLKFFTFGGATSIDKQFREVGISWWENEQPTPEEIANGMCNLKKHNYYVDYVITHTTSNDIMNNWLCYPKERTALNTLLDFVQGNVDYTRWYFGHFHENLYLPEVKAHALYRNIERIT